MNKASTNCGLIVNLRVPIVTVCKFHIAMFQSIHHVTGKHTKKPKKKQNLEFITESQSTPVKHS